MYFISPVFVVDTLSKPRMYMTFILALIQGLLGMNLKFQSFFNRTAYAQTPRATVLRGGPTMGFTFVLSFRSKRTYIEAIETVDTFCCNASGPSQTDEALYRFFQYLEIWKTNTITQLLLPGRFAAADFNISRVCGPNLDVFLMFWAFAGCVSVSQNRRL